MTQFNPQQQEAIDALNTNVIVSASAGAGKTTVLIARLMKRILIDHIRIDEVCAMTFTEAAAGEMKIRLLDALNDAQQRHPSDFIAEQIALVETAQISTIHSFCLRIIKNYGYILGINPSRVDNILDTPQTIRYQQQAMDSIMTQWLNQRPNELKTLLDIFSANPLDISSFEDAIYDCAAWLLTKQNPRNVAEETLSNYTVTSFDALPKTMKDLFFFHYTQALTSLVEHIRELIGFCDNTYTDDDRTGKKMIKQTEFLLEKMSEIIRLRDTAMAHDITFYDELIIVLDFKLEADSKNESYTDYRTKYESLMSEIILNYLPLDEHLALLHEQAPYVQQILDFTLSYLDAFNKIKTEKNCLDFNDLEILALAILNANDGTIAQLVQSTYKEIMVDEFQDTNDFQDEIIRKISNGSNVFRVGDVKQSIYRFRGAKPGIMQNLMLDATSKNLYLSFNYRSKADIVEYNNYVFDRLMNVSYGMDYTDHDHVEVGIPQQREDSHPVEIHIIESGEHPSEYSSDALRAMHISEEIIAYHQKGYAFKDMVILVRNHASKTPLKDTLKAYNIPHYIDDQGGFYNSDILQSVLFLMEFVAYHREYDLVHVLMSPFFDLTDDAIAELKINYQSLWDGLKICYPDFHSTLTNLKTRWMYVDVVTIVHDIMSLNDVYTQSLSIQDKTNLDMLLERACHYQKNNPPTLEAFIDFINTIKNDASSEASPLSNQADVVTAMTIHQSKGLQFPIVFLWGIGSHSVRDHSKTLLTDADFGIGMNALSLPYRIQSKTLVRTIIEMKQNNEEIEESLRLLYVALTRPQKHLIIVDVVKSWQPQILDYHLLMNHRRKIHLLAAASPPNTLIKHYPADAFDPSPLVRKEIHPQFSWNQKLLLKHEPEYIGPVENTPISLVKQSLFGMMYGTSLHEAIERLPHTLWDSSLLNAFPKELHGPLTRYNTHPFTQSLYQSNEIEHEMPYLLNEQAGVIDFYTINDTTINLVDFKSDNASAETLIERYKDQIDAYNEVLSKRYPKHIINAYIYSFHLNDYIPIN